MSTAGFTLEEMDSTLHRRDLLTCSILGAVPRMLQYDGQRRASSRSCMSVSRRARKVPSGTKCIVVVPTVR